MIMRIRTEHENGDFPTKRKIESASDFGLVGRSITGMSLYVSASRLHSRPTRSGPDWLRVMTAQGFGDFFGCSLGVGSR